jgi:hypothetical protein
MGSARKSVPVAEPLKQRSSHEEKVFSMRRSAFSFATVIAIAAFAGPVSAATSPITVTSSPILVTHTPFGPIMSCPVSVTFSAAIRAVIPSGGRREIQYKWVDSTGADALTQTAVIPTAPGLLGLVSAADPVDISVTRTIGAGKHWEQLQITYPADVTTPPANFTITCPTPGALTLGL